MSLSNDDSNNNLRQFGSGFLISLGDADENTFDQCLPENWKNDKFQSNFTSESTVFKFKSSLRAMNAVKSAAGEKIEIACVLFKEKTKSFFNNLFGKKQTSEFLQLSSKGVIADLNAANAAAFAAYDKAKKIRDAATDSAQKIALDATASAVKIAADSHTAALATVNDTIKALQDAATSAATIAATAASDAALIAKNAGTAAVAAVAAAKTIAAKATGDAIKTATDALDAAVLTHTNTKATMVTAAAAAVVIASNASEAARKTALTASDLVSTTAEKAYIAIIATNNALKDKHINSTTLSATQLAFNTAKAAYDAAFKTRETAALAAKNTAAAATLAAKNIATAAKDAALATAAAQPGIIEATAFTAAEAARKAAEKAAEIALGVVVAINAAAKAAYDAIVAPMILIIDAENADKASFVQISSKRRTNGTSLQNLDKVVSQIKIIASNMKDLYETDEFKMFISKLSKCKKTELELNIKAVLTAVSAVATNEGLALPYIAVGTMCSWDKFIKIFDILKAALKTKGSDRWYKLGQFTGQLSLLFSTASSF